MTQQITQKEALSFVAGLTSKERSDLIRLIATLPNTDAGFVYSLQPTSTDEFGDNDDGLAWEGEGWDEFS